MTANLYEKNDKYHVMLSWYQGMTRKQKSVTTRISVKGNNITAAKRAMKSILREWEDKITDNYQEVMFSDYMLQWLETIKRSIEETTYFTYKATIERQINPYFAERKIKLSDLKPHHIQAFYTWKMDVGGVKGNTIHHYHANIHKALKDAVKLEQIKDNPASKVTLPKKERFEADFYTAEEMRVLLDVIRGEKIETPVYLASWFGLRRGEVLAIRWQDIDFESMVLYVRGVMTDKGNGSRTDNLKYRSDAKTRSSLRSFPLPPYVGAYLKHIREQQEKNRLLLGRSYNTTWKDFICVDVTGELIKPEYLSRAFPRLLEKHGLRRIRLHELRDSNASLLLDNGVDMKLIQLWLGHSHYSTTADIYAHHKPDAKQKLSDVLSKELVLE